MGWATCIQFPAGGIMTFFLLTTASRPVLGPTQPPIQWMLRLKRPGPLTSI